MIFKCMNNLPWHSAPVTVSLCWACFPARLPKSASLALLPAHRIPRVLTMPWGVFSLWLTLLILLSSKAAGLTGPGIPANTTLRCKKQIKKQSKQNGSSNSKCSQRRTTDAGTSASGGFHIWVTGGFPRPPSAN